MSPNGLCQRIRSHYPQLTRTERRVADVVLADPSSIPETATARLAEAAQVSQPQVIRFCRSMGFEGLSSFKRALTASLALGQEQPETDGWHPLLTRSSAALGRLDRALLSEAAHLLADALQVHVLADAAHAPLLDLSLRGLWRLGLMAQPVHEAPISHVAPVCLVLGVGAGLLPADAQTVVITERAVPQKALQLITGTESDMAPLLMASLTLQLLLAEVAAFCEGAGPQRLGTTIKPFNSALANLP